MFHVKHTTVWNSAGRRFRSGRTSLTWSAENLWKTPGTAIFLIRHSCIRCCPAVTALSDLLAYAFPLLKKNGICIFPKGRSYKDEIKAAENKWNFQYDAVSSATDSESVVLVIRNLTRKGRS